MKGHEHSNAALPLKMHTLTLSKPVHAAVEPTGLQLQVLNIKLPNSERQKRRFVNEVVTISKARQAPEAPRGHRHTVPSPHSATVNEV